jgi:hypothetical protein
MITQNRKVMTTIMFYKTLKDYDNDKPAAIYIITRRGYDSLAVSSARTLEKRYNGAEVKVLIEGKDNRKITRVLDMCIEADRIVSPSPR